MRRGSFKDFVNEQRKVYKGDNGRCRSKDELNVPR